MEPPRPPSTESQHQLRHALRPAGPARLEFSVRQAAEGVVLAVEGELDLLTAPRLAAELNTLIRTSQADMVVDLRQVEFIDSAGLQILMNARRRLDQASRRLAVLCGEGPVRRVIELARLIETLGVVAGTGAPAPAQESFR